MKNFGMEAGKFEKEILLTSNCTESCNRNVLSKTLVFQGRKVKNFGMASAACVTSYRVPRADPRAFLIRRANSRKKFYYRFPPNEVYFYDINIKLFEIV